MSWQDILKSKYDLYAIRSEFGVKVAEEVERMVYLIDNEDMLDQLIEDIEENLASSSLEHAIVLATGNLRPSSKYDKDIFVYNMNLNRKQNYERFKKSPSGFMDDILYNMINQFNDDMR